MATRYATYQSTPRVTALQLAVLVGNSAAVVSPGPSQTAFTTVSYDDTAANALVDLTTAMSSFGFVFVVDSATSPALPQYRDYGVSATNPTVPAPSTGDRYFNSTYGVPMVYVGGVWVAVASTFYSVFPVPDATSITPDCRYRTQRQTNTQPAGILAMNAPVGGPPNEGFEMVFSITTTFDQTITWDPASYAQPGAFNLPTNILAGTVNQFTVRWVGSISKWTITGQGLYGIA